MLDTDIRVRVKRILRGERRQYVFDRIFLYLRTRHCGRQSLQEIGAFIAHRDQREKGPVTNKRAADILSLSRRQIRTSLRKRDMRNIAFDTTASSDKDIILTDAQCALHVNRDDHGQISRPSRATSALA